MKTDERNKFAIKSFLGEYLDLKKDKDNELETVDSIRKGVEFKGANLWILIFAIFMASLGLNVNSTAVIIGAMLISPLMGPIMGVGLSVGLNDFELMKRSLKSFLITTAFSRRRYPAPRRQARLSASGAAQRSSAIPLRSFRCRFPWQASAAPREFLLPLPSQTVPC